MLVTRLQASGAVPGHRRPGMGPKCVLAQHVGPGVLVGPGAVQHHDLARAAAPSGVKLPQRAASGRDCVPHRAPGFSGRLQPRAHRRNPKRVWNALELGAVLCLEREPDFGVSTCPPLPLLPPLPEGRGCSSETLWGMLGLDSGGDPRSYSARVPTTGHRYIPRVVVFGRFWPRTGLPRSGA